MAPRYVPLSNVRQPPPVLDVGAVDVLGENGSVRPDGEDGLEQLRRRLPGRAKGLIGDPQGRVAADGGCLWLDHTAIGGSVPHGLRAVALQIQARLFQQDAHAWLCGQFSLQAGDETRVRQFAPGRQQRWARCRRWRVLRWEAKRRTDRAVVSSKGPSIRPQPQSAEVRRVCCRPDSRLEAGERGPVARRRVVPASVLVQGVNIAAGVWPMCPICPSAPWPRSSRTTRGGAVRSALQIAWAFENSDERQGGPMLAKFVTAGPTAELPKWRCQG